MTDQQITKIFRALSHETRLKLIRSLAGGERCVCELFQALALPQPKVSQHLAYLRKTGLVKARREGLWQYYSLDLNPVKKLALSKALRLNVKRRKQSKLC